MGKIPKLGGGVWPKPTSWCLTPSTFTTQKLWFFGEDQKCSWGSKIKHCQRHNGPEGWVHLTKVTSWGHITSSSLIRVLKIKSTTWYTSRKATKWASQSVESCWNPFPPPVKRKRSCTAQREGLHMMKWKVRSTCKIESLTAFTSYRKVTQWFSNPENCYDITRQLASYTA